MTSPIMYTRLLVLEAIENDMDRQVARFDELNDRGQELVQLLNNDAGTVVTINEHLQRFQERWDSLVQHMEQQSKEVQRVPRYRSHNMLYSCFRTP